MKLERIHYADLNARQQEAYNFQKVSSVLADFGFLTIRLSDDWEGADFIAQHIGGEQFLKVQLKGRCFVAKRYTGKSLYMCFQNDGTWYLVPHDALLTWLDENTTVTQSSSWIDQGNYHFPSLSANLKAFLESYRLND